MSICAIRGRDIFPQISRISTDVAIRKYWWCVAGILPIGLDAYNYSVVQWIMLLLSRNQHTLIYYAKGSSVAMWLHYRTAFYVNCWASFIGNVPVYTMFKKDDIITSVKDFKIIRDDKRWISQQLQDYLIHDRHVLTTFRRFYWHIWWMHIFHTCISK